MFMVDLFKWDHLVYLRTFDTNSGTNSSRKVNSIHIIDSTMDNNSPWVIVAGTQFKETSI